MSVRTRTVVLMSNYLCIDASIFSSACSCVQLENLSLIIEFGFVM